MNNNKNIRQLLSVAACTVLGMDQAVAAETGEADEAHWDTDSSLFYYSEAGRVSVFEPVVSARKEIGEDEFLNVQLVFDSLSGATPNGALPSSSSQTFTSPSCQENYTVAAGDLPTRGFADNRVAMSVGWDKPLNRTLRTQLGFRGSAESDYTSFGLSASLQMELNQKNTTVSLGYAFDGDQVKPVGGKPTGMTSIFSCGGGGGDDEEGEGGLEFLFEALSDYEIDKEVNSLMLGLTQVLDKNALLQFNLGQTSFQGYLSDPYKLITVYNSVSGDPVDYRFEKRPESRTANTALVQLVYGFTENVVHASWRRFSDDWGIESDTFEAAWRVQISPQFYLRPFYRHYQQSAADFYRHSIPDTGLPTYASSDQRLAEFTGITTGLRLGYQFDERNEVYLRMASISQTGDSSPDDAVGSQQNIDMFPDLKASFFQLGLRYDFN